MIVITGSIATGKSSVCRLIESMGYAVIDADIIAKELISADVIKSLFGAKFIKNGEIDRKALGSLVFTDAKQRVKLNEYIHPLVREEINKRVKELQHRGLKFVVDIPLFFESGNYDDCLVCVVYCPKQKQIQRLIKRENLSKQEAIARVESQIDIEEKRQKADFVIDNSQDEKHLLKETKKFIRYLDANFKV
jgi:dephospho-CoA kinase